MANVTGWAGKILRVNLTTGDIKSEDTMKYKDYIGGMGIGYKVMFDEVPVGTKPFDEANKIIFAAGPLTGAGALCSSRTNITSLLPSNPYYMVTDSHMGGNFAAMMKYAGWDAIIVEGKSSRPVWLHIENDKVTIEDASSVWGQGIKKTTAEINGRMPEGAVVAAIGQAGENMVNLSVIMNSGSHSAGGHGGVMGSKKLKAIGIMGTLPVHIAGDRQKWQELMDLNSSVIGANNNHVVPSTPQPWAEYNNKSTRWTARKGLFWGAADSPVETGECDPNAKDYKNTIGYRTMKGVKDFGPIGEKYTVRMGGCQSCPIRCEINLKVPQLEQYGLNPYIANTCMGFSSPSLVMFNGMSDDKSKQGEGDLIGKALGASLADDYGMWCNYGQLGRDFEYAYKNGIIKKVLPKDEYDSIPWDKLEKKDPTFLFEFYKRLAFKEGELSHLGDGHYWVAKRWNFGDGIYKDPHYKMWSPLGFPVHHSNEAGGQVGALISCMFNRDAQCHTHMNLIGSGLPIEILKDVVKDLFGSGDALDAPANYTPMNEYKAKFAKWSIIRNCLHDSLTLCNWMWPMTVSPRKDRNYRGDTALESKYFSLATGIETSEKDLDLAGERIFNLHRALSIMQMGTIDMRHKHDLMYDWIFDKDPDKKPFTPGTDKMDREDMQKALTMLYKEMGWDEKTGAPKKETLLSLGMKDVADKLESLKLLP